MQPLNRRREPKYQTEKHPSFNDLYTRMIDYCSIIWYMRQCYFVPLLRMLDFPWVDWHPTWQWRHWPILLQDQLVLALVWLNLRKSIVACPSFLAWVVMPSRPSWTNRREHPPYYKKIDPPRHQCKQVPRYLQSLRLERGWPIHEIHRHVCE